MVFKGLLKVFERTFKSLQKAPKDLNKVLKVLIQALECVNKACEDPSKALNGLKKALIKYLIDLKKVLKGKNKTMVSSTREGVVMLFTPTRPPTRNNGCYPNQ